MVNIGLKMVLWKPKHVAKKLMYCSCVDTEWTILLDIYLKGKGKFTLEQSTKFQRGSRGMALLFH